MQEVVEVLVFKGTEPADTQWLLTKQTPSSHPKLVVATVTLQRDAYHRSL